MPNEPSADALPVPILVYGTARSGTTALTNLILSHENVAGLAHPLHWGAHEIPLHDYARYWGDLRRPGHLNRFLEDLEGSDLWRLAGEESDWWRDHPPAHVYEWFVTLMDRVAARRKCGYWVAKLDPKVVNRRREWRCLRRGLRERYRHCRVVGVRRSRDDVLASYLRMPGPAFRARRRSVARSAARLLGLARYRLHERDLARLERSEGALVLEFPELVGDPDTLSDRLRAAFGDLGPRAETTFPRNTSFDTDEGRGQAGVRRRSPSRAAGPAWRLAAGVFDRVPGLAAALVRAWEWRRPSSNPLYYRLRRAEEEPDALAAEFRRTGHEALIPHIFVSREQ